MVKSNFIFYRSAHIRRIEAWRCNKILAVRIRLSYIIGIMKACIELLEKGKKNLFSHNAHEAMLELSQALELCGCNHTKELGEILFYLGIAFMKLGQATYAKRCWLNAFSVREAVGKGGDNDPEWQLFLAVQMSRYLKRKPGFVFDTLAEGDMVHDLVLMTWQEISDLPELRTLSTDDRITYYFSLTIIFPELGNDVGASKLPGKKGEIVSFISKKQ